MIFLLLFLVVFLYLAREKIRSERRLRKIPIRIHVNGTRGKSSVTRLIAAALRHSGIRTLAKTTGGSEPQLILPDGSKETIRRWGPANILEQLTILRRAEQLGAEALVVECMALDPALQWSSEAQMIRSTVGVITNVRPDHFEVMGGDLDGIAESLSQGIPANALLVTGDRRYFPFFSSVAYRRGSRAILADPLPAVSESPGDPFFFQENVAIARAVCSQLGLDPAVVMQGQDDKRSAARDGAGLFCVPVGGKTVWFVEAFSANDVDSTRIIQEGLLSRTPCPRPCIALFNNREDRPLRMRSFANDLLDNQRYDYVALIGKGRSLAERYIHRRFAGERVFSLSGRTPEEILEALFRKIDCPAPAFTVVGMGNEKGLGSLFSGFVRGQETG